jgi:PKD repeat protein
MRQFRYILLLLLPAAMACKKDKVQPDANLFYEVSIDGNTVTFKNETTGATSYKWDFGDGTTSTDESPVHTYPGKGKYVPTLYATTAGGKTTEGSTVIHIAKSSPIKLDDNSLADWDTISVNVAVSGPGETYFKSAKFDYDANYIYVYLEMNTTKAAADQFDFYLDTDGSAATGLLTGDFPGGGYDALLEGPLFGDGLANYVHTGGQNDFSFSSGATGFYDVGTTVQTGSVLKAELRLNRAKITGLAASQSMQLGIITSKNDWSATLGHIPDAGTAPVHIDMQE